MLVKPNKVAAKGAKAKKQKPFDGVPQQQTYLCANR